MARKVIFPSNFLVPCRALAIKAGELIMTFYQQGHAVRFKDDKSPVTEADRAADRLIVAGLQALDPDIAIVSEEGEQEPVADGGWFWLVDPLDGTRSFVRGSGYFTVNIALVSPDNIPVLGVIYDPVAKTLYSGIGDTAFRHMDGTETPIACRPWPEHGSTAIVSSKNLDRSTEAWLAGHPVDVRQPCASSIKFCFLAEGSADTYPRFGPTMEWDTAAGHAILLAAGGNMVNPDGTPFCYRKTGFLNGSFVAGGLQK